MIHQDQTRLPSQFQKIKKRCLSTDNSWYMEPLQPSLWITLPLLIKSVLQTSNQQQALSCSVEIYAGLKLWLRNKYSCTIMTLKIILMPVSTSFATLQKQFNLRPVHQISTKDSIKKVTQLALRIHMVLRYRISIQDISTKRMQTSYVFHEHRQIILASAPTWTKVNYK